MVFQTGKQLWLALMTTVLAASACSESTEHSDGPLGDAGGASGASTRLNRTVSGGGEDLVTEGAPEKIASCEDRVVDDAFGMGGGGPLDWPQDNNSYPPSDIPDCSVLRGLVEEGGVSLSSRDETVLVLYPSSAGLVQLPLVEQGDYRFEVDWGDGTINCVTSHDDPGAEHVFEGRRAPQLVRIRGHLVGWSYGEANPIYRPWESTDLMSPVDLDEDPIVVLNWGNLSFGDTSAQFERKVVKICTSSSPDLSRTTSLASFLEASVLLEGDLSQWDVSGITDMSRMFRGGIEYQSFEEFDNTDWFNDFNGDISAWDTSQVRDMSYMFAISRFDGDLSRWDTSQVETMEGMFDTAFFSGDIESWDTSRVRNMSHMFSREAIDGWGHDFPPMNHDLSGWNTSNVTNMSSMFACDFGQSSDATFNGDISSWDTSSVTDMSGMFRHCSRFNGKISSWDVSSVTDMTHMLYFYPDVLAKEKYDDMLLSWAAQPVKSGVRLDVSAYCSGLACSQAALVARQSLIDDHGWDIRDSYQP